jgi:hypothetical protein
MRKLLLSLSAGLALAISTGVAKADPPEYYRHYHHRMSNSGQPTTDYLVPNPGSRFNNSYSVVTPFAGTMPYNNYQNFVWNGNHTPFFYWNQNGYNYGTGWSPNFPTPYQFVPR